MLSDAFEKWLKKSQKKKGIAIGIKQERSRWQAWNMRRELAQSEGRELTNHHQMG